MKTAEIKQLDDNNNYRCDVLDDGELHRGTTGTFTRVSEYALKYCEAENIKVITEESK